MLGIISLYNVQAVWFLIQMMLSFDLWFCTMGLRDLIIWGFRVLDIEQIE